MNCASQPTSNLIAELMRRTDSANRIGLGLQPAELAGAFAPLAYDLTQAGPVPCDTPGYGLYFPRAGNDAAARLTVDFRGGGRVVNIKPGALIITPFKAITISRGTTTGAATTGTATLTVFTTPSASFRETVDGGDPGGALTAKAMGPGGASTQTINSAAGNVPTTVGDGVSLLGKTGFRVTVSASAGQTLSGGGSIRLWGRSTNLARYAKKPFAYLDLSDATTQRDWMGPDEIVSVPDGELYAEAVSVTASGGASLSVNIDTWG